MPKIMLTSFNSGKLSRKIEARVDIEKYQSGCKEIKNMIPTKYGGVERRPGSRFIHNSTVRPS